MTARPAQLAAIRSCFSFLTGLKSLSCSGRPCAPSYSTLSHQASRGCRAAAVTRPYLAVLPISLLFCFSSFSGLFYFMIIYVLHKLIKNCDHKRKQICTLQSLMNLTSLTHHMVQFCTPFQIWSIGIHVFIQACCCCC